MAIFQGFPLMFPSRICLNSLFYNFYSASHRGGRILLCLLPDNSIYLLRHKTTADYET